MLPVPPIDPLPRARERVETVRSTTQAALAPLAARAVVERGIEAWPQAVPAADRPVPTTGRAERALPSVAPELDAGGDLPAPVRGGTRGAAAAIAAAAAYGAPASARPPSTSSAPLDLSPVARALLTATAGADAPGRGALVHVSAPLNDRPPQPADVRALSSALAQAIEDSGLFYEAHLAQWIAGDRSTERIRFESAAQDSPVDEPGASGAAARVPASTIDTRHGAAPAVAERVSAQLALLDTGVLRFAGEAWPGQRIDIEIVDPRDSARSRPQVAPGWRLRLVLSTPALGELAIAVSLDAGMLALNVAATNGDTRRDVHRALPRLRHALASRELPITALALNDGPA